MVTLNKRLARSLVTVIFLTLIQVVAGPILAPTQTSPAANAAFDSSGLILQWDMQNLASWGGSGTTMGDASMNSSTGTLTKAGTSAVPTYTSATTKYMTISGGSTNYNYIQGVDVKSKLSGYATSAASMQNISIFAWVYPTANGIIVDETNADNSWQDSQIEMADGRFSFRVWNSTELIADTSTPLNYWYYVGLTYDITTLTLKAYINGKLVGQLTNLDRSAPWETNSSYGVLYSLGRYDPTNLGSASGGNFRFGALQIYNRAISQASIIANYEYDLYWYGPTVGNPADKTQYVNRSDTLTVTACAGTKSAATCNYKWEVSSDGGTTWSTVGTSSSSYVLPILTLSDNGKKYRVTATDPGAAGDVPEYIRNYAVSTAATLTVQQPPGSDTDTAITLTGSNFAQVATNSSLNATGAITVEAWTYMTSYTSGAWNMILNKENAYELGVYGGYWWYGLQGASWSGVNTGIAYELNAWHHVAFTRAASTNSVNFYLDGALVFTGSADGASTGLINASANPLTIGGRSASVGSATALWNGQIDEVRAFNTVRSATDILSDMHSYISPSTSNLLYYYDFNEGSGTTIYNRLSGATSATDLTLYNSPTFSDLKDVSTSVVTNYTTTTFDRTYLTSTGGWKVPTGVSKLSGLIVAGGGGGGWNSGGGGSGGGFLSLGATAVSGYLNVKVGQGGVGALATDAGQVPTVQPIAGQSSIFGSTSVTGGNPGGVFAVTPAGGAGITTATGTSGAGGNGSSQSGTAASAGSAGLSSSYSGTSVIYSSGGGGGGFASAGGAAGSGAGAGGGSTTQNTGVNALPNRGGGGGASAAHVFAGNGGSGIIIIRWITAAKPTYTAPVTAYLNVGMTETFTTNVAIDSATANLTRTFRWESSTTGAGGSFSLIKQGTGAANAYFAWVPQDTTTTGSNFVYRVIVTDSDTAGLFIVDTSTPVWAVINRALVVSGTSTINKAINVVKNETFTVTYGTSTYNHTLTPTIAGITLDTSTAGSPVIRISDTVTVGTYYETLTVVDSVSATIVTPLVINVVAPPQLSNTSEIVTTGLVFNFDASNSASYNFATGAMSDISGSKKPITTVNANNYSSDNFGIINFPSTSTSGPYAYFNNSVQMTKYAAEAFIRLNGSSVTQHFCPLVSEYTSVAIGFALCIDAGRTFYSGFRSTAGNWTYKRSAASIPMNTWTHLVGTFDGTAIRIYLNSTLVTTYDATNGSSTSGGLTPPVPSTDKVYINRDYAAAAATPGNTSYGFIRLYNIGFTQTEVDQNYNAVKDRFTTAGLNQLNPSQKYGQNQGDTFTVTSGVGTKTTTFSVGDRAGIDWDTTTVTNQVKLSVMESLTVGTYYDTMTVTDSLGQSTSMPMKISISKADTITVTLRNAKTLVYTGFAAASLPDIAITGLVSSDTGTATRLYSAPASAGGAPETYTALVNSSVVPTDVETYTVSAAALTSLTVGSLNNYQGVVYETSTLTITQAKQPYLTVNYFGAIAGSNFTLYSGGGAGSGAVTETVTAGGSGTNCAITGHVLSNSSGAATTSTCNIVVTKAASRNYKVETLTATIYFLSFGISQQTQNGAGSGIGITGINTVTLDTTTAPTITGLSTYTLSLATNSGTFIITGAGFGLVPITVKFWRNKSLTVTSSDGSTLSIPISSITALTPTTGKVMVITANGIAVSIDSLTITP